MRLEAGITESWVSILQRLQILDCGWYPRIYKRPIRRYVGLPISEDSFIMVSQLLSSISSDRYLLGFVIAVVAIVACKKLVPHRFARRKVESSHSVPSSPIDEKQDRPFGGMCIHKI